ncbi:MAG TPA: NAD(P)-dependent oxidoreductase [Terriglobia bacterium]|nr:NAD(P)-dependent oxidoreductase [Terriglobia bacterium]
MKAGFVGLGNMGQPMARNLLRAGHDLTVFNRTASRAEDLVAEGARVARTVAEACAPGIVMTILADDRAVEECTLAEGGILSALPPGGLHVSHSTIGVALSRRLAEEHGRRSQNFVSAPVFGRPPAAAAAQLLVVAGGEAAAVERARPLLESLGRKLVVLGADPAMANTLKLAGNFMIASMLEAVSEALALARKSGVAPAQFLEVLTFFQSPVYDTYGRLMAEERFEPAGFKMTLGLKDVRLVLAAADSAVAPMPLASLVHDHLLSGVARGLGEADWSALARVAAEDAGLGPSPR